jgi:hypothetical protein
MGVPQSAFRYTKKLKRTPIPRKAPSYGIYHFTSQQNKQEFQILIGIMILNAILHFTI